MTSVTRTALGVALLLGIAALPGVARDLLSVDNVTIHPDTQENRRIVESLFSQGVYAANRLYGDELLAVQQTGATGSAGAEAALPADERFDERFSVSANAVRDESQEIIHITMTGDGSEAEFTLFGSWESERAGYVAGILYYLRAALRGFPEAEAEKPPRFVAELPFSVVSRYHTGGAIQYMMPYDAAAVGDDRVFVAAGPVALELSSHFKVSDVIGSSLPAGGVQNGAYAIGATEAGTVYLRPAAGPHVYRFHPGIEQPDRLRVQLGAGGTIAALKDGSLLLRDLVAQRISRLADGRSTTLKLFMEGYGGIVAAGPDGGIWTLDAVRRRIGIHSAQGELLDTVVPLVPPHSFNSAKAMAVTSDGAAIVLTGSELWRVERSGRVAWKLDAADDPRLPTLQTVNSFTVDPQSGAIYLVDIAGQRIVRLLDPGNERLSEADRTLIELAAAAEAGSNEALRKQAELYEELGAYEMALALWEELSFAAPGSQAAQRGRAEAEVLLLQEKAARLDRQTREQLELYGPETARSVYSQAIQAYERALSLAGPAREETLSQEKRRLEEAYRQRAARPSDRRSPLEVAEFSVEELFPALLQLYQERSAGLLVLRNGGSSPLRDLTAELNIRRYMDFPAPVGSIDAIEPGGEAELQIPVPLSREVLELEEQMPAQAQITVRYRAGANGYEESRSTRVTIHRRTALSWDDSAKLASFVTPNEEVVSRFAHRVVSSGGGTAEQFVPGVAAARAARIADAVGTYGMAYIEDPDTPISAILGDAAVVDTVRFPRTTLLYRSGDCDDTTALLSSLYESVGIGTAILTSPGHVFMAFDTGEPAGHAWMYETEGLAAIRHGGTVWLPIETTVLPDGFDTAWREASRLYRRYEPSGDIELIPLSAARERYRPVPLAPASFEVVEPAPERVAGLYRNSAAAVRSALYSDKVEELRAAARDSGDVRAARRLNRLGVLHARYAAYDRAVKAFQDARSRDRSYGSPLINLANVYILTGRPAEAVSLLETRGDSRNAAVVDLVLAQAYSELGRAAAARSALNRLSRRAPELAERYAYLAAGGGESGERASEAARQPVLIWAAEE